MRIFFPVEDTVPDAGSGPLVPYRCGLVCAHALRGALEFRDGVWAWPDAAPLNDGSPSRRPAPLRSSAPGPR